MAEIDRIEELTLVLPSDGHESPVNLRHLTDYLQLFRGAYAACASLPEQPESTVTEGAIEEMRRLVRRLTVSQVNDLFAADLGESDLVTIDIWRENPMKITVRGLARALVAAVILSGGRFSGFGMEAELPPIGHGIERLREALVPAQPVVFSYGVRSMTIRLNRAESEELMSFDPATRNRGGFQRFLISLQFRVRRRTRELDLSENDIDTILRHGRQPRRGGWQASIHRIFARHFDLTPLD
jgi:hypothetical protein